MLSTSISALILAATFQSGTDASASHALTLQYSIPMPLVQGRMDHLAIDAKQGLVYVAALANDTLECADLGKKSLRAPRTGMKGPAGIAFLSGSEELVVANGGNGDLDVIRDSAAKPQEAKSDPAPGDPRPRGIDKAITARSGTVGKVHIGIDTDNVRFDPVTHRVIVGFGSGGLALLRTDAWLVSGVVELGGHPESFQVSADGKRAWVNVPGKGQIAVIDLVLQRVDHWIDVKAAKKNYPMALVESEKRLLVGCRDPGRLLVYDTETDALVAELPLSGDVDDVFADAQHVYASCGEGFVDVFEHVGPGAWKPKEKIETRAGARTCLLDIDSKRLFVAVPRRDEQPAELRVFSTGP